MRDWSSRRLRSSAEYSEGPGHQLAQVAIRTTLQDAGLPVHRDGDPLGALTLRVNRQQVVAVRDPNDPNQVTGYVREPGNVPDDGYQAWDGRQANVEIDTTRAGMLDHFRRLVQRDPDAHVVTVLADDNTGAIREGRVYDPNTRQTSWIWGPEVPLPAPRLPPTPATPAPTPPPVVLRGPLTARRRRCVCQPRRR